jgi:tRNA(Ile)-lysidine synthase
MFDRFLHALTEKCCVKYGDGILVCCSGGIDSMVLIRLMNRAAGELGLKLHAVTVDHGLRCEAPGDAQFVLDVCAGLGVEASLYELKMDPQIPNLEEQARIKRYEAIFACRDKLGFRFVATGHTADDQAETLIYRLARGTGIRGMSGMEYARHDGLIRPMLDITRAEVEAFAAENCISFVTDQTNSDMTLVRNLIRKRILPLLREINSRAETAISRFARIASLENAFISGEARKLAESAIVHDWKVCRVFDAEILARSEPALLSRIVIGLTAEMTGDPRGIPESDVEQALEVVNGKKRAHTIMRRVRIKNDGKHLSFEKLENQNDKRRDCFATLAMTKSGHCEERNIQITKLDAVIARSEAAKQSLIQVREINQILLVNRDKDDFTVRQYMPGDRIGDRKVTEIFQARKIPVPLRRYWPVVVANDRVISVAGLCDTEGISTVFPYEG